MLPSKFRARKYSFVENQISCVKEAICHTLFSSSCGHVGRGNILLGPCCSTQMKALTIHVRLFQHQWRQQRRVEHEWWHGVHWKWRVVRQRVDVPRHAPWWRRNHSHGPLRCPTGGQNFSSSRLKKTAGLIWSHEHFGSWPAAVIAKACFTLSPVLLDRFGCCLDSWWHLHCCWCFPLRYLGHRNPVFRPPFPSEEDVLLALSLEPQIPNSGEPSCSQMAIWHFGCLGDLSSQGSFLSLLFLGGRRVQGAGYIMPPNSVHKQKARNHTIPHKDSGFAEISTQSRTAWSMQLHASQFIAMECRLAHVLANWCHDKNFVLLSWKNKHHFCQYFQ